MLRIFYIFSIILFGGQLYAQNNFREYKTTIQNIKENVLIIKDNSSIKVGASGIVIHKFDDSHKTIAAGVVVVEKDGSNAKLQLIMFDTLKQKALPSYNIAPQIGDTVIINYLYNKALAITPNHSIYKNINKRYPNINWVHPDIIAAELTKDSNPKPEKKDFQNVCKLNALSLLFFAVDTSGYFVDCHSFKVVDKINLPKTEDIILPFYSRIGEIEKSIFNFTDDPVTNYNAYYKRLLEI